MKQINSKNINKEINYSVIKTMNIKTLNNTIIINYSTNLIDFYTRTLNEYLPLNGINIGIDKISETIQNELYNLLYYPIKNELFDNGYLQEKHSDDFNDIFSFLINGEYFDYNPFNANKLIDLIESELNRLFIRIKKNNMRDIVLNEIEKNDNFILDIKNLTLINNPNDAVRMIKDCSFTQLLSFVYFYDDNAINYNLNSLTEIVLDLRKLANTKKYTDFIKSCVEFEIEQLRVND